MQLVSSLDHVVLLCPDIEAGTKDYATLLGRTPDWRASSDGVATAVFKVQNTAVELMAPDGADGAAPRLRELTADGPALTSLAFSTENIETAHHKLGRRGLEPSDISVGESLDTISERKRSWRRFRCSDNRMAGIKTFVLQPETELDYRNGADASVSSLDHIVINTPNPDRALATYGGRLGLDLALDRTAEEWKTRFLFFRVGGLTFEVIHRLDNKQDAQVNDHIWDLTWSVQNLDAAHSRLEDSGLNVSDIRKGRKPGSRVFTVRDGTLNVPTLFISHMPR
ncbi:VOC family protein [Henriciella litoralis]|uniref:VOC family protein n=1 Tax=Henriciella litoralis TaxID=568102 RepID=UPI0009FF1197|nr:VOC family protein [Henriciella litoralis]